MTGLTNLLKQGLVIYGAVKPAMNRYYLVLLGLALGILVGVIFVPIYFRPNAEPVKMDDTYREQWIKDTANGYQYILDYVEEQGLTGDEAAALQRSAENEVKTKLTDVGATPSDIDALISDNTSSPYLVNSLGSIRPLAVDVESAAKSQKESADIPGALARALTTFFIFVLFGIIGAVITLIFKLWDIPFLKMFLNMINPKEEDPSLAAAKARKAAREQAAGLRSEFDTPPVSQFMSTYLAGDNYYDDSFAIELDDENKTFLGECGSGISESINVGTTKKVIATEVWIFDKNDISTITKVLVSEAAYNDPEVRAKLAPRGDVIVAKEGEKFDFETQTLRMQATVVSLEYAESDISNHVYEKVTVELAVWQKEGADTGGGGDDDGFPQPVIDVDAYLAQQAASQPAAPPAPAPTASPPTRQQTQPMPPQGPPPTGPSRPVAPPPQQRPPVPQQGPPPQQRPPMPQQGPPPQQRPPMPQQGPPPQQRPPMPQQRPPQQGQPPQQRPPMPQQGQQRPPMPQQSGPRPQIPPQQGQRPPMPQQGQRNRPQMPPQNSQGDSPFGDTGDFNLQ